MDTTVPKPFVFVLMPFAVAFDDVYHLGIRAACEHAGAYCERVDEQMYEGTILNRIYNQIANARLVIADMTGRNPNVFYEVGYAHALGKRVVLLTQNEDDIPFDLRHYPHIVYRGRIAELKDELCKRVGWALSQPEAEKTYFNSPLRCYFDTTLLLGHPTLKITTSKTNVDTLQFRLNLHNSIDEVISVAEFQCGFVCPSAYTFLRATGLNSTDALSSKSFPQPDGTLLHIIDQVFSLLPGAWERITLLLHARGKPSPPIDKPLTLAVRLFTPAGPRDYSCTLAFQSKTDTVNQASEPIVAPPSGATLDQP